jgi:menaquinone-dependent protoporphyrinogen oxidase
MQKPILVAYASRHGSTAEVARAVGQTLIEQGNAIHLQPVTAVTGLEEYRAVVAGAPIYSSNWLPEATDFVRKYQRLLGEIPTACFIVSIRLRNDSSELRRIIQQYLSTERLILKPVSTGFFAGALDYKKLSPIVRLQAETKGLPEGDYRNWEAIRSWASELHGLLVVS